VPTHFLDIPDTGVRLVVRKDWFAQRCRARIRFLSASTSLGLEVMALFQDLPALLDEVVRELEENLHVELLRVDRMGLQVFISLE
jgi:hypothetical protein